MTAVRGAPPSRRAFLRAVAGIAAAGVAERVARAAGLVPPAIQAQLVAKIAAYDRNFGARAGGTARVLVAYKPSDVESTRFATLVVNALNDLGDIAGKPKQVETFAFGGAAGLASRCGVGKASLLYLSTGLEGDLAAIAKALEGVDVLDYGATREHAQKGAVVGFALEEGKPKLIVNLAQAKAQNVSFKAEFLKLAQVI